MQSPFLRNYFRQYIAYARQHRPTVPKEVSSYVVESYVRLRKLSKDEEEENKSHSYTSARTLLGILRLSQAHARLRCADAVDHGDVDEALRLMECSKESLKDEEDREVERDVTVTSQIFRLIKKMIPKQVRRPGEARRLGRGPGGERDMDVDSEEEGGITVLSMVDIRARILSAGFTETQLIETITKVKSPFYDTDSILTLLLSSTKLLKFVFALLADRSFNCSKCIMPISFFVLLSYTIKLFYNNGSCLKTW